ncbi:extensin family protein [Sphingomonas solaris]|uniref:Extensin family protein n=1 Tax=Alterirhizorhabdus solaris TaxID=2529389 RepID=A0A558QYG7_9SPHN|nr:extensin family protein [Sphingomonas solaris]TVV72107.1 extensin family protein [Sphingomonas solaris]
MRFLAVLKFLVVLAIPLAIGLGLYAFGRGRPQDLPWTALDLGQPVGLFTARKLAMLADDAPRCRMLLADAGVRATRLPPRIGPGGCGYADGVTLGPGGTRGIAFAPAPLGTSCAIAASLAVWEWEVVQPAALAWFGRPVTRIDHFGSYSCRRIYGRASGRWSEHSTADAVDIAGFRLGDGTRITVARDWKGGGKKAAFLHDVRDGACRLFATTLSPDYNAAHADHLHLDQAARGKVGMRGFCPSGPRAPR